MSRVETSALNYGRIDRVAAWDLAILYGEGNPLNCQQRLGGRTSSEETFNRSVTSHLELARRAC